MRNSSSIWANLLFSIFIYACSDAGENIPAETDYFSLAESLKVEPEIVLKSGASSCGSDTDPCIFFCRDDHYGGWLDLDGDGFDTRAEVLIRDSLSPVKMSGSKVIEGEWSGSFCKADQPITDASQADVDHLVSLKEASESGACTWSKEKRQKYANELGDFMHLQVLPKRCNRSKSDSDPDEWKEKDNFLSDPCAFAKAWVKIKIKWELSVDSNEKFALLEMLSSCN